MKRMAVVLLLCLFLSGCGNWMDGSYSSVTPHKTREQGSEQAIPSVKNFSQIKSVFAAFAEAGSTGGLISVEEFPNSALESSMDQAIKDFLSNHPLGAYAVESVTYELGTTGGIHAVSVSITYSRSVEEIRAIRSVSDMTAAREQISKALADCEPGIVLRVDAYEEQDLTQLVADYALTNPDVVMEIPQVTATVYPQQGSDRVLDIRFAYQTSRDSLRTMQRYVAPVFTSAALYVSSEEETDNVKYARLFTFLKERNDYQVKTSITPTYSLLRHGVGDSRAFAYVYAAMCAKANLPCQVVAGTREGEAWFWNIICVDGIYYHVDVLSAYSFTRFIDEQMTGYVWDYSSYPVCGG